MFLFCDGGLKSTYLFLHFTCKEWMQNQILVFVPKKMVVQGFWVSNLSLYTTLLLWEDSHTYFMLDAGD